MLFLLLAHTTIVMASEQNNLMPFDNSPKFCFPHPIEVDVITILRTDRFCLQPIVIPSGEVAQLFFANRETYCGELEEDEKDLAKLTGDDSTMENFCTSTPRSFFLTPGSYYIGVSASTIPLQVSLTYKNVILGCDDIVDHSFIDIPLTFKPNEEKCSIVLPGKTILHIKNVTRIQNPSKNPRHCARVRMGKNFYTLNVRWEPVCEIPDEDSFEYELGCGSIVMDASSLAIEKVEFVLKQMEEFKSVVAPFMCADNDD